MTSTRARYVARWYASCVHTLVALVSGSYLLCHNVLTTLFGRCGNAHILHHNFASTSWFVVLFPRAVFVRFPYSVCGPRRALLSSL